MAPASLLDLDQISVPVRENTHHRTASLLDLLPSTSDNTTVKVARPARVASLADLEQVENLLEQGKLEMKVNLNLQHRIECGICFRAFVGQYKTKYCSKACVLESRRLKRAKLPFPKKPLPTPEDPEGWKDGLSEEDWTDSLSEGARRIDTYLRTRPDCFDVERERTFVTCRSKARLRFDFALPTLKVLIEYHGEQHFKAVAHWGGEEGFAERQKHDKIKRNWAYHNGWRLIEVPHDTQDIEDHLAKRLSAGNTNGNKDKKRQK